MNHKQKLGYIVLGAAIMAVGITIGQFVTSNIEAQLNGVFDEIQCSKLTVVDKAGRTGMYLIATEYGNGIMVYDTTEKIAIQLTASEDENDLTVYNKAEKTGIRLTTSKDDNGVTIANKVGEIAIQLAASEDGNGVIMKNKEGKPAVVLVSLDNLDNSVNIYDGVGDVTWTAP